MGGFRELKGSDRRPKLGMVGVSVGHYQPLHLPLPLPLPPEVKQGLAGEQFTW